MWSVLSLFRAFIITVGPLIIRKILNLNTAYFKYTGLYSIAGNYKSKPSICNDQVELQKFCPVHFWAGHNVLPAEHTLVNSFTNDINLPQCKDSVKNQTCLVDDNNFKESRILVSGFLFPNFS